MNKFTRLHAGKTHVRSWDNRNFNAEVKGKIFRKQKECCILPKGMYSENPFSDALQSSCILNFSPCDKSPTPRHSRCATGIIGRYSEQYLCNLQSDCLPARTTLNFNGSLAANLGGLASGHVT